MVFSQECQLRQDCIGGEVERFPIEALTAS